ncbi:MAG: 3'-5' exonuclease [Prevotellaceae bacterium]|jgi:predicted PolB exonuclease-like 3'-5' exonuclease|nr:3'-5' exonuclease [Prevotellaceae bacterium]
MNHVNIEDILFMDVETVPQAASYNDLPERMKTLWEKKTAYLRAHDQTAESIYERAGIWAEFGKIICISAGFVRTHKEKKVFRVKSFFGDDEKQLLLQFCGLLHTFLARKKRAQLCAHNGREFDFPYIARRLLINGLPLPQILNVAGRKTWEIPFLDTMELWKFGDYKHFCSLDLLTAVFNIPTPKDDMDGSQVAAVYYEEKNMERIVRYCEKDAMAVAQLLLRYRGEPLLTEMEKA